MQPCNQSYEENGKRYRTVMQKNYFILLETFKKHTMEIDYIF